MNVSYLQSVIKISNFAKAVEKLIDAGLIVFDEGIESDHVGFFGVRWFVRQILQHLCDLESR